LFGGSLVDCLCAGACGLVVGLVSHISEKLKANQFFRLIGASFFMALLAYCAGSVGIATNADAVIIGALMILVPGLVFTNAMRDIIYGDTNSGINRIVQVLLVAAAIALGTGAAYNLTDTLLSIATPAPVIYHNLLIEAVACFVGCTGFFILFNIHGPGGFLCALGGMLAWAVYCLTYHFTNNDLLSNLMAAITAAAYSEIMARVRKYPAISYLVVSIFPLLPGAGIYYTTIHLMNSNMADFASKGGQTIGIAGALAVGILTVSTLVRLIVSRKRAMH
jgi:uncharacterized membrane protein YjjB (DUF3815 family)